MLTELALRNIKFTGKITLHKDDEGLFLRVTKRTKRWQLSFSHEGKMRHYYGGEYPATSLKDARKWASDTRELATSLNLESTNKFCLGYYLAQYRKLLVTNGRKPATLAKLDKRIKKYLKKHQGVDVRSFTAGDATNILMPIGELGYLEAQSQIREILKNAFLHVKVAGLRSDNPVDGLHAILPKRKAVNRAAITDIHELGEYLRVLYSGRSQARPQTIEALKFLAHTFPRPENIYSMEWTDIKKRIWHIPKEKMKGGEHPLDVYLSDQAYQIIWGLRPISGDCKFVFGRKAWFEKRKDFRGHDYEVEVSFDEKSKNAQLRDVPMNDYALRNELISMGYYGAHMKNVPEGAKRHGAHGNRAMARTIMDEVLEWALHIIEQQLAHMVRDTNGVAYNRTKHWKKRMMMMQLWSNFLDILREGNRARIDAAVEELREKI